MSKSVEIRTSVVMTYGRISDEDTEDIDYSHIMYAAVDLDRNVYVYDLRSLTITSYSDDRDIRWTTGSQGEGPEEITSINGMIWAGGHLILLNQYGRRIDRISADGSWLSPLHPDSVGIGFGATMSGVIDDRFVVFRRFNMGMIGAKIAVVDLDIWSVTDTFTVDQSEDIDHLERSTQMPPTRVYDGSIAFGNYSRYRIDFHSTDGTLTQSITQPSPNFIKPVVWTGDGGPMVLKFNYVIPPLRINEKYSLAPVVHPARSYRRSTATPEVSRELGTVRSYDLYDNDLNRVASFPIADHPDLDLGGGLAGAVDGHIYYIRNSPIPHVAKVKVDVLD